MRVTFDFEYGCDNNCRLVFIIAKVNMLIL